MAIVDIGQSVPMHGTSKMIQIESMAMHKDSPNSTAEHTTMGISSGKSTKTSTTPRKRNLPLEIYSEKIKKPNLSDTSISNATDVSKEFGIISKEITLTRLNMSPRSQTVTPSKTLKKTLLKDDTEYTDAKRTLPIANSSQSTISTCESNILSECRDIITSKEISIMKVNPKREYTNKDKLVPKNNMVYLSKDYANDCKTNKIISENESERENYPTEDFQADNHQDEKLLAKFWDKPSASKNKICQASTYLHNNSKPRIIQQNYSDSVITNQARIRNDENWETEPETQLCAFNAYQDTPRLSEESWDTYDLTGNNQIIIQDQSNYSPDSAYGSMGDSEMSHYMLGFPNPPGENRCWLNATLHTLFATLFTLPIAEDMQQLMQYEKCSKISLMLGDLHELWRKGGSEKTKIYNIIKKFKESLSLLERTYCSDRQQDVSEFLMALLNHLKSEFDKILPNDTVNKDQDNASETNNPNNGDMRSSLSNLCLNSPMQKSFSDTASSTVIGSSDSNTSPKLESNNSNDSFELKTPNVENPIDKYFLQKMVEDYVCKECSKHRQIPIENLMVYAEIPSEDDINSIDLTEVIQKTFAEEERNLVCEHCKHGSSKAKTFYKEYPKVLTIQILRYGISNDGMMNKICTAVSIPEKLSLNNFLLQPSDVSKTYEPICIISHVGSNMDCGHYTSYVKHDDQWFHYNDMSVMPLTSKEALTAAQSTAYLLFYVDSDLLDKPTSDCYSTRCSPIH